MVLQIFSYVYKTVLNEFIENVFIVKEIFSYHTIDVFEKFELKKKKKELKKSMKKAKNYQEWKEFAENFDNLKGTQLHYIYI